MSVFAGLRCRHPGIAPQELRKTTLLALTQAIEDECCARAEQAVLFAEFQQERFYTAWMSQPCRPSCMNRTSTSYAAPRAMPAGQVV